MVVNRRSKCSEVLAVVFVFVCLPAFALPPRAVVLHSGWRFRALNDSVHSGVDQWRDAEVPGVVQMDLLRNKLIADPFYRDNEKSLQWIGLTDWEYQTEFDVDAATLARGHLDLLFGGLDTFADVYLNDAQLSAEFDIVAGRNSDAGLEVEEEGAGSKKIRAVEQRVHLDEGTNHISIPFRVSNPSLWYPNGYGQQTLYKFFATLSLTKGKKSVVEDTAELRTGLRSLELRRDSDQWGKSFTFVVNGIPIFAKGADVIPFDSFPTRVTPAQRRQILQAARDAHMNMIRHWGGGYYESDDFYDICDELGIMVWQDR